MDGKTSHSRSEQERVAMGGKTISRRWLMAVVVVEVMEVVMRWRWSVVVVEERRPSSVVVVSMNDTIEEKK